MPQLDAHIFDENWWDLKLDRYFTERQNKLVKNERKKAILIAT